MLKIKVKILEGINVYGEQPAIKLIVDFNVNLSDFIQTYKEIEEYFDLHSEIQIIKFENNNEIIIKSRNIYSSMSIANAIISEKQKRDIIAQVKTEISLDWACELKKELDIERIPYIYDSNEEIQIGYGVNAIKIRQEDLEKTDILKIIEIMKSKESGLIPIIAVTGTNGKTTTVRLIHNILLKLGYKSGLSSTGGIYIGENNIKHGDTTGFYSAREVLKDSSINVAVLETARGGILKKGLGYKRAKVAIITSLTEDHMGLENVNSLDDLLNIKSLVANELDSDGIIVVKATEKLFNKFKHLNNLVVFDDSKSTIIDEHIKNGGRAYYVNNNKIYENNNGNEIEIMSTKDLNFAFNGISKSNVRNVIAAFIAVYHIHKNVNEIISVIKDLECNIYTNLGRQNLIDFNKFKMLIDYGHNSESFNEVFNIAKSLCKNKIIGVITAPGDRGDRYIEELGEIAARFSDNIIIKEQPDLRGREVGETATILKEGALKIGYEKENIKIILDEESAVLEALKSAEEGDIIVSFSQFLYLTIPIINKFRIESGMDEVGTDIDLSH